MKKLHQQEICTISGGLDRSSIIACTSLATTVGAFVPKMVNTLGVNKNSTAYSIITNSMVVVAGAITAVCIDTMNERSNRELNKMIVNFLRQTK